MRVRYWLLAAAVIVAILILLDVKIWRGGPILLVENSSPTEIKNVLVGFTGGSVSFATIAPKATHSAKVTPSGESHLTLQYCDAAGALHSTNIGCYFERNGYGGSISIRVTDGGVVRWKDDIHPRTFWL